MLALDPPADPKATIGGAMATNDSGPLRHRYGSLRDLVVGTTVALSDGTLANSGGRVIKNVAGYDLGKLFCGSHGTLGLITRVAVRLHPLVPETATATGGSADAARARRSAAAALAGRPLEADCARRRLARRRRPAARALRRRGLGRAGGGGGRARCARSGSRTPPSRRTTTRCGTRSAPPSAATACSRSPAASPTCPRSAAPARRVVGRAGLGLFWLQVAPERVAEVREALHPRACALLDAPDALRGETWPVPDPGALAVMERLKQRFDPARAFRPGAFVGGL